MSDNAQGLAMPASSQPLGVCFVCLGNICRSPLAEVLFRHAAEQAGLADQLAITSRGTGDWHVGKGADRRSVAVAAQYGLDLSRHRAAQLGLADLRRNTFVVAMDRSNHDNIVMMAQQARVDCTPTLMLSWDPAASLAEVPDPYYSGPDGFDAVYAMLEKATKGLLGHVHQCKTITKPMR